MTRLPQKLDLAKCMWHCARVRAPRCTVILARALNRGLLVSNFLLWQIACSELYIFGRTDLPKAILAFQKRDRRFGGLNPVTIPTTLNERAVDPRPIEALGVSSR